MTCGIHVTATWAPQSPRSDPGLMVTGVCIYEMTQSVVSISEGFCEDNRECSLAGLGTGQILTQPPALGRTCQVFTGVFIPPVRGLPAVSASL